MNQCNQCKTLLEQLEAVTETHNHLQINFAGMRIQRDQARAEAERLWDELDGHDREPRDPLPWKAGGKNG